MGLRPRYGPPSRLCALLFDPPVLAKRIALPIPIFAQNEPTAPNCSTTVRKHGKAQVVFSQDFHPKNHVSFASHWGLKARYPNPPEVKELEVRGRAGKFKQAMWPDHCVQGSGGAELLSADCWL